MQALAALAGAIESVADVLKPAVAEQLSSLLVARMLERTSCWLVPPHRGGTPSIADEPQGPAVDELVCTPDSAQNHEQSSHVMRGLAFSVAAFKERPWLLR